MLPDDSKAHHDTTAEILDLDVPADKIVTQADNFSWDQLVLDSDEGNVV